MHLYINVMQAMCKNLHYSSGRYEKATANDATNLGAEGPWNGFGFRDLIQKPQEKHYWKAENCEDSFLLTGKSSTRKKLIFYGTIT